MAMYKSDQRDILFNLIDVLNITEHEQYGLDAQGISEILSEHDKFVEQAIYPTREETDEKGVTLTKEGVKVTECLHSVTKQFYENGWYGLGLPEDIGGTPVPEALASGCLALSCAANTGWSMYPVLSRGAMNVIRLVGDDYLKNTFVPPMMEGKFGGTMCLTESGAGSDVGACKTTAKPIEGKEGWYKISGSKIFISGGENDLYDNIINLVLAKTPGAPEGTKGISLFMVPRYKVNADGSVGESNDVRCSKIEHKMGIHASATCVLNFGDEGNCEGYMVGPEFQGMAGMFIMMNQARLDCGIQGESQANLAYMLTEQYVKERAQFGKEIINHPDVRRTMLKMRAMSRGLRALMLYTSNLFDLAHKDKTYDAYVGLLTPVCKAYGSDEGFKVCVEAMQCHGGYGYCTEYGIEQFVRDAKISSIYEGTNGIQAIDFVTRKILKDGGKTLMAIAGDIQKDFEALDATKYPAVKEGFGKALVVFQSTTESLSTLAKEGKISQVLQHCTDYMNMASTLIVAWRLMASAQVADKKLAEGSNLSDDDKKYLQTKSDDLRIFNTYYLPQAIALSKTISLGNEELATFDI